MDNMIFMLAWNILPNAGGVTQGILNRTLWLHQNGYNTAILTMGDELRAINSKTELIALGRTEEDTPWINLFDYYRSKNSTRKTISGREVALHIRRWTIDNPRIASWFHETIKERGETIVLYRKNGILRKKKVYGEDMHLSRVNYYNDQEKHILTRHYGKLGFCHRVIKTNPKTKKQPASIDIRRMATYL